jgi:pimeloyl-ACP methyl ester carboxylesterase
MAAAEVLREQRGVDPGRVGLLGISQGGWVAYLAASLAPETISQLVSVAGPGVSAVEQERFRLACATGGDAEALAWVDERARRIGAGDDPVSIITAQRAYSDRPWFAAASEAYDDPGFLGFAARNFSFDPATVLPKVRCRVFAARSPQIDLITVAEVTGHRGWAQPVSGRVVSRVGHSFDQDVRQRVLQSKLGGKVGAKERAWQRLVCSFKGVCPAFGELVRGSHVI